MSEDPNTGFIDWDTSSTPAELHFKRWTRIYPMMLQLKAEFIDKLSETGRPYEASKAIGVPLRALTDWRRFDPAFDDAWSFAWESVAAIAQDEAFRRAVEGVDKDVYYEGVVVGQVKEYSDSLLAKILTAYNPKQFSDKGRLELTGKDGGAINMDAGKEARDTLVLAINTIADRLNPPAAETP